MKTLVLDFEAYAQVLEKQAADDGKTRRLRLRRPRPERSRRRINAFVHQGIVCHQVALRSPRPRSCEGTSDSDHEAGRKVSNAES